MSDPWVGKHSWDELIYEAEETHGRHVELGGYGTLYLRLADALREAEEVIARLSDSNWCKRS